MDRPLTTYLAGVAVSNYAEHNYVYSGQYQDIPVQLLSKPDDVNDMIGSFGALDDAIATIEHWYGPYGWDRIGFVMTAVGAMEHSENIAYPDFAGLGGNNFGQRRLMAHELAHHWWGNQVTLSSPADMWFKEGNAEYSAHLMVEYVEGREAFVDVVKANFRDIVLRTAHIDDGAYLPLSGIPFENTYGTHTYNKGASMVHNIRGYMGDSLFSIGMQSVLDAYAYGSLNGEEFRDQLMAATGVEMSGCFDGWIFNPGYAAYELNGFSAIPSGNEFEVTVDIQQKLHHAPEFHHDTPLEMTFMDDDMNQFTTQAYVSGEFSTVTVNVPFEPTFIYFNGSHLLNMAVIGADKMITEPSDPNYNYVDLSDLNVSEIEDSAFIRVEHYWVAPDPILNNPFNAQISSTHYWRIDGIFPDEIDGRITFDYKGINENALDFDLTGDTEEDIILVYRPDPSYDWSEHDDYTKLVIVPTDGNGIIRAQNLRPGEYAFANGELPTFVNTKNPINALDLSISPNPTSEQLTVNTTLLELMDLHFNIYDLQGRLIHTEKLAAANGVIQHTLDLLKIPNGAYILKLNDGAGKHLASAKVEVLK